MTCEPKKALLVLAVVFGSIVALAQSTPAPVVPGHFTIANIDVPGAQLTSAAGINNAGTIVGTFTDAAGVTHGYLADNTGAVVNVIDFPGATFTAAGGINEKGDIVGTFTDANNVTHAYLLQDGNFTTLDFPGAAATFAQDINDQGEIAGGYQNAGGDLHGWILDKSGFQTVDDPAEGASLTTQLTAVNNRKDVEGFFTDNNGVFHTFLVSKGTLVSLDVPGATFVGTISGGLSDRGDVAASFFGSDFVQHGFVLDHGIYHTFDFPTGVATAPTQINASGTIVGVFADAAVNTHSFLAKPVPGNPDQSAAVDLSVGSAIPLAPPPATPVHAPVITCGQRQPFVLPGSLTGACH
jgi:probable HAF family extracellular repeat protein